MKAFRFFSVFSFLIFFCVPLFCAENSTKDEAWVLAAQKFDFSEARNNSKAVESAASVIPKLILEQLSLNSAHTVFREEHIEKKLDSLLNERLALFLELQKEVKARDSLILNNYTMVEYETALKAQEKKIKAVQDKIDKNLEAQNATLFPETGKKKAGVQYSPVEMPIGLYKSDSQILFEPSSQAKEQGVLSRAFAKEISSAKISALICGNVVVYGNYAYVTAELYTFPGAKKIASIAEVGTLSQISQIAESIAAGLQPKIANGIPVQIEFDVFPQEAKNNSSLTIDNTVYSPIPQSVSVSSGVHSVSVSAEGYARESFLYDFSGSQKFSVEVNFRQNSDAAIKLVLSKFVPGNLFVDGKFAGEVSRTDFLTVPLSVNGNTVFAYFEGEADEAGKTQTMFMMIPSELMVPGMELETDIRVYDIAKNIDKRRKRLYLAYSSLLVSMPFMFYSYGRYNSYYNGYVSGYGNIARNDLERYRNLSIASIGLVSACGVWMTTELILYLIAADKTLPPKAKKVKSRTLRKMEMEE